MSKKTLEQALEELCVLAPGQVTITAGPHFYREGFEPRYKWEVVASYTPGDCYPPFHQSDDLMEAVEHVIGQLKGKPKEGN